MALSLPNTGMAVSIDIGDAADIHPKNKQEVGRRLALIALANNYGEKVSCSGPLLKWSKTEGNKIILSFSHADKGLTTKDGSQLKGFSIAGADRKFHWAKAIIRGNEVEVSAPEVTAPSLSAITGQTTLMAIFTMAQVSPHRPSVLTTGRELPMVTNNVDRHFFSLGINQIQKKVLIKPWPKSEKKKR
ncbi:hypothetical protein [Arcticibacter sp. MXS-1]|uniref:hypothetical protein n=1 Tax=Arcticibacter sp. MXS-1 TaxID=3341726 RepID=UPI0035A82C21